MRCGSCAVSASASRPVRSVSAREHDVDQPFRTTRRLLRQAPDARARRHPDGAVLQPDLARDGAEQRGLADAVAADQPDARAVQDARRGAIEKQAPRHTN